jgi:hypothetical protein
VVLRDEEGVLAASPQEAIAQARAAARDMAAQHFLSQRFLDPVVIEVVDEQNVVWGRVPMRAGAVNSAKGLVTCAVDAPHTLVSWAQVPGRQTDYAPR